jgi:hypothetical protein
VPAEEKKALEFLRQQAASYGANESEYLRDERVWTDLCHVAFNLKEFVFVE